MPGNPRSEPRSAERLTIFTDAVVAIALTLLILPLLESVSELGGEGTSADYVREHSDQLISFGISFVVIAAFWWLHHSLYEVVERYTPLLMRLNFGWMFTIVWLPVATALVGSLETDRLQAVLYIGTMLLNSLLIFVSYGLACRHPELWAEGAEAPRGGYAAAGALSLLMTVALVITLVAPEVGYLSLFVLFLTGPVQKALRGPLAGRTDPALRS